HRHSQRAGARAETLVREARVYQGRQGRLLFPKRAEIQNTVRDVWLQRQGKPRRGPHVADRLRAEGVDRRRRGKDRRAREESGGLSGELHPRDVALEDVEVERVHYRSLRSTLPRNLAGKDHGTRSVQTVSTEHHVKVGEREK